MTGLRSKFIVFDGGEGCGKSTQIRLLRDALVARGSDVELLRDPGTTRIGEQIRAVLLNPDHQEMGMRCEMLLYMSARAQMMHELIRPALDAGKVVLCDRFVSSTLSYQLGGDGLTADEIRAVARVALRATMPDLTIILDMPAARSIERVRAKFEHRTTTLFGTETKVVKDRIEMRPMAYHEQVRENFLRQAKDDPAGYRVVNADRTPDEVHADVLSHVQRLSAMSG
jgi:dTMP kinase